MPKLPFKFWNRHPSFVAPELIGCTLTMNAGDQLLRARIVETEAYHQDDEACHAFGFKNRKKTNRVAHFFGPAGVTYVYLNYGIHKLLNVITGPDKEGSAVLIRALEPLEGIEMMRANRGGIDDRNLGNGPGKLTQALGIELSHNQIDLFEPSAPISFKSRASKKPLQLDHGPRVGITKATGYLWRFAERGSPYVSKAKENKLLKSFEFGKS